MKKLTIGYRDMFRLIAAINMVASRAKDQLHQRQIISINFQLQKAIRNGEHSFIINEFDAAAISEALEMLLNKPFRQIVREYYLPEPQYA